MKPLAQRFPALSESVIEDILKRWDEPHRQWHGRMHLENLLRQIEEASELDEADREMLRYVALFHDAIYLPLRSDNEEESALLAGDCLKNYSRRDEVVSAILATKAHDSIHRLAKKFNEWDCSILDATDWGTLKNYESGIAFEYSEVDPEVYRRERSRHAPPVSSSCPCRRHRRWAAG